MSIATWGFRRRRRRLLDGDSVLFLLFPLLIYFALDLDGLLIDLALDLGGGLDGLLLPFRSGGTAAALAVFLAAEIRQHGRPLLVDAVHVLNGVEKYFSCWVKRDEMSIADVVS